MTKSAPVNAAGPSRSGPPGRTSNSPSDALPRRAGERYRAPARLIGGQFQIESRMPVAILTAVSLGLCSTIFPPLGWWPLAFVALVPWAVCVCTTERPRWVYVSSYLLGVCFFAVNVRWLAPVTLPGYLALCFFFGAVFPLVAWPVRHMFRRHGVSLAIALPIVWTAGEYVRSQSLAGFPWYLMAHTQYRVLPMIQISDLVGAYGVSFVVVMINGWITDLLIQPILIWRRDQPERTTRLPIGSLATLVVVSMALIYGAMSREEDRNSLPDVAAQPSSAPVAVAALSRPVGPVVAIIQHDLPSYVDLDRSRRTSAEVTFRTYMSLVRQAAAQRPDVIVLPETAWPGYFNDQFLNADPASLTTIREKCFPGYSMGELEITRAWCRRTLAELRKVGAEFGVAIVTGSASIEGKPTEIPPRAERYNSAFMFPPQPGAPAQRYDKNHLVLFGEFVPFRYGRLRTVYRWLNAITPWGAGGLEYSLSFGKSLRAFDFLAPSMGGRRYRAAAPICYEDTEPYIVRGFAETRDPGSQGLGNGKEVDLVFNISNDGWFNHSSELEMHLAASVFRAVENRVGVARSVNTGASAMIDPSGRIHDRVELLPAQADKLPAARAVLEKVRNDAEQSRREPTSNAAIVAALGQMPALHKALADVGDEFRFIADRLSEMLADSVASGSSTRTAERRDALVDQIDDDIQTLDRWRSKPWTAPGLRVSRVRTDTRHTLYSRWGDWFATGCAFLTAAMLLDWVLHRIRRPGKGVSPAARAAVVPALLLTAVWIGGCERAGWQEPPPGEQGRLEERATHFLLTSTGDPSPLAAVHAIEALQETAPTPGRARIRACLKDETPPVRFAALLALGIMGDRESIEIFRACAEDNDRTVRIAAIFAMHRAGDTSRTGELSTLLFSDPDQQVRATAAMAIGLLGDPKAMKVLNVAQKDKSELVRLQCIKSMALLGDKKATRSLIFEAHSGSGPKMVDAIMSLASTRTEAAEELFEYRLKEGPYDEVRLASACGLGRLGKADGYALALQMLAYQAEPAKTSRDDPPAQQEMRMRTLAATALGAIGDRRALEPLARTMDDETQPMTVRIAAARAVLDIRRAGAERALAAPAASAVPRR